jgi:hypothetical protein
MMKIPRSVSRKPLSLLFLLLCCALPAQEGGSPAGEAAAGEAPAGEEPAGEGGEAPAREEPAGLTEAKVIGMDIRTSTLQELAVWCRSLGLPEGGGREELAARLRNHYQLEETAREEGEGGPGRRIVIESARVTEYFTLEVVDEEYARLRGNVTISLTEGEATHRISAQEILYNRTRNQVTARGKVSYVKEEGDTIETFRGDSITVNLDSWATVLTEGISERALTGEDTAYRFAGTVISRSQEEVTILRDARVTNASTKNSYWSLNATKLWLLPGSDFALQNMVLKVGEIPLLYLPFFYYPADEVVFHPVLGYRSREGNFIQTTTYILGRPKPEDLKESSLTKILGSGAGMEKELQGIFLRSTGKRAVNPSETSLKAIFDAYANLGLYFGLEMKTPGIGLLKNFEFSSGLGRTRDVMPTTQNGISGYTPYPRLDGESDWNKSQLFSWNIPLRYRLKTSGSLAGKAGEFSWELPYYSDPYVDRDFLNRSESMDWFHIIQEGAALDEESTDTNISSYEWRFNGRVNITPPKVLAPYLTTLSISNLSSTMLFSPRASTVYANQQNTYSPSREFYFPDKFTIYSMSFRLGGTPLTIGGRTQTGQTGSPPEEGDDPFAGIGVPRSPWEREGDGEQQQSRDPWNLSPPVLGQSFTLNQGGGPQFSISYDLNPAAVSELQFRTGTNPVTNKYHWAEAEDVDWGDVSSVLSTIRGDLGTSFSLTHPEGAYATTFRLSGSGSYQNYSYANRDAEEFSTVNNVQNALTRIYNATFFTTSYDYLGELRPLYRSRVWGTSSFSYSFKGLLAKSVFEPDSLPAAALSPQLIWDARPRWKVEYGAWDKESLDTHQLNANINANVMDQIQNFSLTTTLPPRDSVLSGSATARVWFSEFNANMRVLEPWEEEKRKLEPLNVTGTFKFGDIGSLEQYMSYDSGKHEYMTLSTKLNVWGFSAGFTAINGIPFEFVYDPSKTSGNGWVQQGTAELHPQDLRFGFAKSLPAKSFWKDRFSLSLNVNTNLLLDLQRYTYSKFDASLGVTVGITEFLDLSLSATSENALIYRYLRNIPAFELPIESSGEQNFFKDLLNSFRFDNEELRTNSGFKLKSFNLKATHHMGDWNAALGVVLSPYLEMGAAGSIPHYKFNTQISFVVQWLPISEIKSELTLDKDRWVFK